VKPESNLILGPGPPHGRTDKVTSFVTRDNIYYDVAKLCVSLTIFHIKNLPLRQLDGSWYLRYVNRLIMMGEDGVRSNAVNQNQYRARRRRRLASGKSSRLRSKNFRNRENGTRTYR